MPNNWYHTPNANNQTGVPKGMNTHVLESVKREAKIGEKIVIVQKHYASDFLLGDIFTVTKVNDESVTVKEEPQGVYHWEYEVITK